ncbi:16431_t:CDS:2, partial [Racocetra persica]
ERQIRQLRTRITELEAIINRTPAQEQELQDKKKELAELEKQQQEGVAHIVGLIVIGKYVVKIKYKEAQLELRTKELEKKNGHEQHQIDELKKEVQELKK